MKVIFLDIDGVLNSDLWFQTLEDRGKSLNRFESDFDPVAVKNLQYIIDKTGAKLVISSCWRSTRTVEELQELMNKVGIKCEVIGKTERLRGNFDIPRGCEIKKYLRDNFNYPPYDFQETNLEKYVIIDDDSDMLLEQLNHFVQTSWREGLTHSKALACIRILNKGEK